MKADKIRQMETGEIQTQAKDGLEQMFRLRFQLRMGQTDGIKKVRDLRKDRARQLTILRERELAGGAAPAPPAAKAASKPAAKPAAKKAAKPAAKKAVKPAAKKAVKPAAKKEK
ncbi:MAG: 50S ribosomal protein L29 [Bryobacteraceae bacterium]|nr:50S ribosomal protein L29 [Bryobacteraceae bacterium]